jgi:hypothetical protein
MAAGGEREEGFWRTPMLIFGKQEGRGREYAQDHAMSDSRGSRLLLSITAALEAATGLALIGAPGLVVLLLIGGPLDDTATTVAHIAGAGLIGLALACWPGKGANSSLHAALTAMLAYNVLATLVLGDAAITGQATGMLLWPAIVLHAILSGLLAWARFGRAREHAKAPI